WSNDPSPLVTPSTCLSSLPFLSRPCLFRLLAKLIGIAIITLSCINKAPVLRNIYKSKSVLGLSPTSTYGEVIMYSNAAFYNLRRGNPFTAYGETFMVMLQTVAVVVMIWVYGEETNKKNVGLVCAGYVVYLFVVFYVLTQETLYILMVYMPIVLLTSRGSQILANYQQKQTGAQSLATTGMNLTGSLIRTVTTIKEVGWDLHILRSYGVSITLNMILFTQIFVYKENTQKVLDDIQQKKKKKEE
ncbi:hypothetical protein ACHAWT_004394, partial [Skeletonema menzelii]